jgi:hypothetical protein
MTHSLPAPSDSVTIQGSHLVVKLHGAVNPVIWQVDVLAVRSALFDVVSDGPHWQVRYRVAGQAPEIIAHYTGREAATAVMEDIHTALTTRSGRHSQTTSDVTKRQHVVLMVAALALLVALSWFLFDLTAPRSAAPTAPGAATIGVPQSADELLSNPGGAP